jgi:hypothetical protein
LPAESLALLTVPGMASVPRMTPRAHRWGYRASPATGRGSADLTRRGQEEAGLAVHGGYPGL